MAGLSANIYYTDPAAIVTAPTPLVYLSRTWYGERVWVPWLYPGSGGDNAGQGPGTMTFDWKFGYLEQPGLPTKILYPFLNLANAYIFLDVVNEYGTQNLWCGEVDRETIQAWGSYPASGMQSFTAQGLSALINRRKMDGSIAYCIDGSVARIDKKLTFNKADRGVTANSSNMSTVPAANGCYFFYNQVQGTADALTWNARRVAEYILGWEVNRDLEGDNVGPDFYLSGRPDFLVQSEQVWHFSDFALQALNTVIDPRRGLGYRTVTDGFTSVWLDVFSGFLADNPEWYIVPIDDRRIRCTIDFDHSRTYDMIEVIGGPICICGTWSMCTGTYPGYGDYPPLIAAWSAAQEVAYNAVTGTSEARDKARQDPTFRSVFQAFQVNPAWNWTNNGNNYSPVSTDWGTLNYSTQGYLYGDMSFSREIPFWEDVADGATPDLKRAMAWMYSNGGYSLVEKLTPGAQMTLMDNVMGVIVEPSINHVSALNTFTDTATNTKPKYDFNTLHITAMVELSNNLKVRRYLTPNLYPPDVPRKKVLEDKDARVVIIAPNTITGVDTTNPAAFLTSGGTPITFRNDAARMNYRANLAQQWYTQQRCSITLRIKGIHNAFRPGSIIAGIVDGAGMTAVGTVVSSRTWDFHAQETVIQTTFQEFDLDAGRSSSGGDVGGRKSQSQTALDARDARVADIFARQDAQTQSVFAARDAAFSRVSTPRYPG